MCGGHSTPQLFCHTKPSPDHHSSVQWCIKMNGIPELEVLGMGSLLGSGMQICGIGRLDGTIADFEGDWGCAGWPWCPTCKPFCSSTANKEKKEIRRNVRTQNYDLAQLFSYTQQSLTFLSMFNYLADGFLKAVGSAHQSIARFKYCLQNIMENWVHAYHQNSVMSKLYYICY